jgi:hypothetical protein
MNCEHRALLVGALLLAVGGAAQAQFTSEIKGERTDRTRLGITAADPNLSHRDSGLCPRGSEYRDGCPGASAGNPAFPTLLTRYKARPPWNVAGVDFAVGIPRNVVLKDPRSAVLPSACSLGGTTVTCSGKVTLDGYDFSLNNGTTLIITGGDVTVQNCLFIVGSNQGALGKILDVRGATNATFLHNDFDGSNIAVTPQSGQTINVANRGTITFRYNYFHNSGGDMIDFGGGPQVNIIQYNVFKDIGLKTAHSDTLQWCRSIVSNSDLSFNTIVQTGAGLSGMGLIVPNSECAGAKMSNVLVHNNTLVSRVQDNFASGATVSQDAGPASADHVAIFENYVDPTGIIRFTGSPWFPTGSYGANLPRPSALHSLIDMRTGFAIPVPSKRKGYYVYPDASGYTPALSDIYSISASPLSGALSAGDALTFVLEMDEPWEVTGTPTLKLNSGGVANYTEGSGTATLRFTYIVGNGQSAAPLGITAIDLSGGAIRDTFGNRANLAGALKTFSGITVR